MRILIATPLYPPAVGGPATYVRGLEEALKNLGHTPVVESYGSVMHLPSFVRQLVFTLRLMSSVFGAKAVISLDTLSIGFPAMLIARLFGIPGFVRVAGDQVWEHYVNRTGECIPFSEFYFTKRTLTHKEKVMFHATNRVFALATRVVFSTRWQAEIRSRAYHVPPRKLVVIENAYHIEKKKYPEERPKIKVFVWAGRNIPLKNLSRLTEAFRDAQKRTEDIRLDFLMDMPHKTVLRYLKEAWAIILPSFSEDSPNVLLEGLAEGKPFISTAHNGLRDRIGELGLFVDPKDVRALTDAIALMADEKVHDAYVHRIEEFEYSRTYDQIAKDYLDLISGT
jgi:glycosyltransferase involved in cell wall biosynthesis